MDVSTLITVVKKVILDWRVITAVIVVVLYLDFVSYVQHYRKKPPVVRTVKKKVKAASGEGSDTASSAETESGPADSGSDDAGE